MHVLIPIRSRHFRNGPLKVCTMKVNEKCSKVIFLQYLLCFSTQTLMKKKKKLILFTPCRRFKTLLSTFDCKGRSKAEIQKQKLSANGIPNIYTNVLQAFMRWGILSTSQNITISSHVCKWVGRFSYVFLHYIL